MRVIKCSNIKLKLKLKPKHTNTHTNNETQLGSYLTVTTLLKYERQLLSVNLHFWLMLYRIAIARLTSVEMSKRRLMSTDSTI